MQKHILHSQHKNAAPQNLPFHLFPMTYSKIIISPNTHFLFKKNILLVYSINMQIPSTIPVVFNFPEMIISRMYKCFICYISSFK